MLVLNSILVVTGSSFTQMQYSSNVGIAIPVSYTHLVETELLIQILSFGPVVKVLGPESFLKQVKERVERQQRLFAKDCSNP